MAEKKEQGSAEVSKATAAKRSTAAKKTTGTAAKKTTTAKKTAETAAKKTTTAKKTTGTAAKKTTTAKKTTETAAKKPTTAKKTTETAAKKPTTTKKTAGTAAKKATTAKKTTATAAKQSVVAEELESAPLELAATEERDTSRVENAAPQQEQVKEELPRIENLPLPLSSKGIVEREERALGDARPPVSFPEATGRSLFLRILLLLAVAAVLVASALIYYHRPTAYVEKNTSIHFLYQPSGDTTHIVVDGAVRGTAKGMLSARVESARGNVCAAVIGNRLYLVNGKRVTEIAEGVLDFTLSSNGKALAYRVGPTHLYYRGTGQGEVPSLISAECQSDTYSLSAGGKELVYVATGADGVPCMRVESYSGNRPYIENTVGLTPIAISDDCAYIYYRDADGALFIFESKTSKRIKCATAPDPASFIFNRDFTELLFTENGGTVLYKDAERRQIVGVATTEYLQLLPNRRVASCTTKGGTQFMVSTFLGSYFLHTSGTGKKLTYLDKKGNLKDVSFVDGAETVTVTDKGVYFLLTSVSGEDTHRILYHVPKGKTETERVDWDVTNYCTNVDGSRVMYTGYQNALYIYRPETGAVRLCDSIVADSLTVTADDLFCFYREPGVLLVSDNGGEVREISANVIGFSVDAHTLYYATSPKEDGTFSVYANHRNRRVSDLVLDGVSLVG